MASHSSRLTLLISCPDQPGIVAAVSDFLYRHQGNILESDQHSTHSQQHLWFFMRISIAETGFALKPEAFVQAFAPIAERFHMRWSISISQKQKRAGIFVSKLDHCLIDLLWRWQTGELHIDIPFIISNHTALEGVAAMYGVPFYHYPMRKESRTADQEHLLTFLEGKVDFIVLARYMQILEPFFVNTYPHRIINIHHSFLPAFVGANPYQRAYDRGVKLIGATAHYVTDQLDEGPIIAQDVIHCNHRDSADDLVRKGRDVERRVLAEAVRLHTEDRVLAYENKTIVFA